MGFFGAEWQTPVKGLTFKAEYSYDKYACEVAAGAIERKSPFNFGLEYKRRDAISFGLYYLHGSEPDLKGVERWQWFVVQRPCHRDGGSHAVE